MKKLILATVACVFLASPVFADDLNMEQIKVLEKIAGNMDIFKNDEAKMNLLSQKKECVEKATDIDTLTICLSQFPQDQRQAMTK